MNCPWPESIWTMTMEDFKKAVPHTHVRERLAGFLMREGWKCAQQDIAQLEREKAEMASDQIDAIAKYVALENAVKEIAELLDPEGKDVKYLTTCAFQAWQRLYKIVHK